MKFCSYYEVLFLSHIFTQRPMADRRIKLSYVHCFGQQLLTNYIVIFIQVSHEKKKWLVAAQNLQSIKTLSVLTLELSQYRKSGSMVSSREQVAACSDCSWLGNTVFVLACASRAEELPQDSGQELGCWFCQLNLWLPSGTALGEIARWQAGSQTWTPTWTVPPDQRVVKVL